MSTKTLLGIALTIGALGMSVSASAAAASSGTTYKPYVCGTWTFPATSSYVASTGNLLAGAKKGAKTNWKNKASACAGARRQMPHAYWKNAHMFIPGWKCVTQFGSGTCTRSEKEIIYVFS